MSLKLNTATAVLATALTLLNSGSAVASDNKITNIKVDGDTVHFSTSQVKSHTLPNCVATANNQQWTLSLNSAAGKASYTLLVAAMTDNRSVAVTSANDCADSTGYERAQSIEVGNAIANTTRGSRGHFGLYKWDGVTKIGTIFDKYPGKDKMQNMFEILRSGSSNILHIVKPYLKSQWAWVFFSDDNCTQALGSTSIMADDPNRFYFNESYNNGQFIFSTNRGVKMQIGSRGLYDGTCDTYSTELTIYPIQASAYSHPLCGKGMCQIKAD